ncbi:sulfatase family protein [Alienimonas chondri]|uniref:Arylsulfatase n=1 Tax=Alienimonas chondri TaxID=2681879 RepID=A0ABX1VA21_9PLAN|nr:sulfatase-like hydrolase/transferase [Alienimonas chondri]NNJ24727.1 Arylsulfatase [Alienimonas chondri]
MKTITPIRVAVLPVLLILGVTPGDLRAAPPRPNVVLLMADDQGWGQVGYRGHPRLKTPHLDAMAAAGLRFDRFYAAGPVCSPTRASVLTGRTPNRSGVPTHGRNLVLQEKTLPRALQDAGYTTAHFGKWHLNGVRGAGVPVLADDPNHPGRYGFDEWLSATNYIDLDPLLGREGTFEAFEGDSSNVLIREALEFMTRQTADGSPFLAVVWYGSPHNPQRAAERDRPEGVEGKLAEHLGELAGIDRSVGALRAGLRDLGIERDTLLWYCSDNGGLTTDPDAMGGLSGHKGDLLEGGIRVPGIIEWPGRVAPAVTDAPASTMDIFPTIVDLLSLPPASMTHPVDGESLVPLLDGNPLERTHGIPFQFLRDAALIDGDYKLLTDNPRKSDGWRLYNLKNDPGETEDLAAQDPHRAAAMRAEAEAMLTSVEASEAGRDYPEGRVLQPPRTAFWKDMPEYEPYLDEFAGRSGSARGKRTGGRRSNERSEQ